MATPKPRKPLSSSSTTGCHRPPGNPLPIPYICYKSLKFLWPTIKTIKLLNLLTLFWCLIANFEQISYFVLVFPLLILDKKFQAFEIPSMFLKNLRNIKNLKRLITVCKDIVEFWSRAITCFLYATASCSTLIFQQKNASDTQTKLKNVPW